MTISDRDDDKPYGGLLVISNDEKKSCRKCVVVHRLITNNCKPIAVRSDDERAVALYGRLGAFIPIEQYDANLEVEIRDHRNDQSSEIDSELLFRVPAHDEEPEVTAGQIDGLNDPDKPAAEEELSSC